MALQDTDLTVNTQSDEEDLQDNKFMSDEEEEKDDAEEELERLIFGDETAFKDELRSHSHKPPVDASDDSDIEKDDGTLANIHDADLFFLDTGVVPSTKAISGEVMAYNSQDEIVDLHGPPAWEDSDDERMMVSLTSVPRLRKLRNFEGEDLISGKEYARRLRRQFELLNPRPEWATSALKNKSRKRRRRSGSSDYSENSSISDRAIDLSRSDVGVQSLSELLRSAENLTRWNPRLPSKRMTLRPDMISIERMKDITPKQPSAITSLSIHPNLPFLISSGPAATLYLHHLEPHPTPPDPPNPLITSLHLKHTPLTTSVWSPLPNPSRSRLIPETRQSPDSLTLQNQPKIYLSSRRRYFHTWNLPTGTVTKTSRIYGQQASEANTQQTMEVLKPSPCGRFIALLGSSRKGGGIINILDAETQQWIAQARIEGHKGVADFAWWSDGSGMAIASRGGEVTEWNVEERRAICRWEDEGAVGTTVIALGGARAGEQCIVGPDRFVAVGSTSGIVNVYERHAWQSASKGTAETTGLPPKNPTPLKVIANLTTAISHLEFSPCGQLLVVSSRWKKDALRLIHMPSCSVYRNWPTARTPLGRVSAVALGEIDNGDAMGEGGKGVVLVVGNEAGVLRGWEIGG